MTFEFFIVTKTSIFFVVESFKNYVGLGGGQNLPTIKPYFKYVSINSIAEKKVRVI